MHLSTLMAKITTETTSEIVKDTFRRFFEDKALKLSGSLAFVAIFSIGQFLVIVISICSLFIGSQAVQGQVSKYLISLLGQKAASELQDIIAAATVSGKSQIAIVIGIALLLFGATSIFAEIQDSINYIWGIKPKPKSGWLKMIRNRLLSFSVIVSLGFLLLVSLIITSLLDAFSSRLEQLFPNLAWELFYVFNQIFTLTVVTSIFAVIFKVLPDAKIRWKEVLIGAITTAFLFMIGKLGLSLFISKFFVGSVYGAAGSLTVILIWVYYSSLILYWGAEFTKSFAIKYGEPIHPADYAVTVKQVEIETGKSTIQEKEKTAI